MTNEPHHQKNVPATGGNVVGRIVDLSIFPLDRGAVAMTFVDVTDQRAAESRLQDLAQRDQLTGLWNRSRFRAELGALLSTGKPAAVALLDLNRFKMVNDTLGHTVGDLLLQAIADRFGHHLPAEWTVARLGGDEFAILIPGNTDQVEAAARRIVDLVAQPMQLRGVRLVPSTSVGFAHAPTDGNDVGELLRIADTALYAAKRSGKDFVICGDKERRASSDQANIFANLDSSFAKNQYELYAQPMVALQTGHIVGAEGLARWILPGQRVLGPGDFLSALTTAGRMGELTNYMLEAAMPLTAAGRFMSINLCSSDLYRTDLVTHVDSVYREHRLAGHGELWLEIVESELHDCASDTIDALVNAGIQVAIDDFGAAHSSLQRVVDHDIAVLKLDLGLVAKLQHSNRAQRLVKALIDAAHDLGALVVAEGIEDEATCNLVTELGCDLGQGYYLGRPAPAGLVRERLAQRDVLTWQEWPSANEIRDWEDAAVSIPDVLISL